MTCPLVNGRDFCAIRPNPSRSSPKLFGGPFAGTPERGLEFIIPAARKEAFLPLPQGAHVARSLVGFCPPPQSLADD